MGGNRGSGKGHHHGLAALHIPGRPVNRASDGYRAEGKTDARDARVVADPVEDRIRVVRLCGTLLSVFPAAAAVEAAGRRHTAHPRGKGHRRAGPGVGRTGQWSSGGATARK